MDQRPDLESSQPNPIDKTTRQLELEIKLEEAKEKTALAMVQALATVQAEKAKAQANALATVQEALTKKRITQQQYDQAIKDWRDLTSGMREQAGYLCFWLSTGSWSNALPPCAQHLHRSQRTPG